MARWSTSGSYCFGLRRARRLAWRVGVCIGDRAARRQMFASQQRPRAAQCHNERCEQDESHVLDVPASMRIGEQDDAIHQLSPIGEHSDQLENRVLVHAQPLAQPREGVKADQRHNHGGPADVSAGDQREQRHDERVDQAGERRNRQGFAAWYCPRTEDCLVPIRHRHEQQSDQGRG